MLCNSSNFCYGNSTVLAYVWTCLQAGMQPDPPDHRLRLALHKVFTGQGRLYQLWRIPERRACLSR